MGKQEQSERRTVKKVRAPLTLYAGWTGTALRQGRCEPILALGQRRPDRSLFARTAGKS